MELLEFAKTDTAARLRAAAGRGALPHALIFSGSGDRVAAARYAAAAMECTAQHKPCLTCPACRKVVQDIHPDVSFVRDAEHKELSVDTVRAMRADAFIRPNEGARKVYIFEDCTILTEKDQNVLLKLVEEGPAYAAFSSVRRILPCFCKPFARAAWRSSSLRFRRKQTRRVSARWNLRV